ncbi:Eukaryotic translation initiation factor eIF-1 [Pleosporales sp. CAS-2024a]
MAAARKDMRRPDLIVPYADPGMDKPDGDIASAMASTMPMAAIFTRNRVAVVAAVHSWLGEPSELSTSIATPASFQIAMAVMSLLVCYSPLFLPIMAVGTEAPAPAPPS